MDAELRRLAEQLGQSLIQRKFVVATAESCTGGWISKAITDIAGSSGWYDRGFITYSDSAKTEMLEIADEYLAATGAVSESTARAMVVAAQKNSNADCAIAVTGIAGPDGGSAQKPVGTVWIAWAINDQVEAQRFLFDGDREAVRRQTVIEALDGLVQRLTDASKK